MPHFYERNIVEIKNEYTASLTNILTPLIYEGINSMYNDAKSKDNKGKTNPNVLQIFQAYLNHIPRLNQHMIETEANRIRVASKCPDVFNDLVKAVIKSYIVLLTYNTSDKRCELVENRYHENISISNFIHKCYIETAKVIYNHPDLFWHGYKNITIKKNQRDIFNIIEKAIKEAIRKTLPMKLILKEYLSNDYVQNNDQVNCQYNQNIAQDGEQQYDININKPNDQNYSNNNQNELNNNQNKLNNNQNELNNNQNESSNNQNELNNNQNELNNNQDKLNNEYNDAEFSKIENKLDELHNEYNDAEFSKIENKLDELHKKLKPGVIPPAEDDSEIKNLIEEGNVIKNMPKIKRSKKDILNKVIQVPQKNDNNISISKEELERSERSAYFSKYAK